MSGQNSSIRTQNGRHSTGKHLIGKHFIGGHWVEGKGSPFQSRDPFSGEIVWEGREAIAVEVDSAVRAAREAFEPWADRSVLDRMSFLKSFAEKIQENKADLAETISRDTGKPFWESLQEADSMIAKVGISIKAYNDRCSPILSEAAGANAAKRFKPHGVVAVLGPFNLPGHLPNGHIVPALLAGNTVVFKPSEQTPLAGQRTVELWEAAGLPPGVLNMVQGGRSTGESLASHPGLDGLFFTGSCQAGKALHRLFAGYPEKILALEMGGNNPLVVWDCIDTAAAVNLILLSTYITSGQRCVCARRLILPQGLRGDAIVNGLVARLPELRLGAYTEKPEPFIGPVISARAAEGLLAAQEALAARGGRILVAMSARPESPALLTPGLMDVTEVGERPDEEYFGPFLQVIRVKDFEAALAEANRTAFGLAAGLISDSQELYDIFYRKVRAGIINWNRQITGASSILPFGGVGASGNHRPSAYYAADYCAYPIASLEVGAVKSPESLPPGMPP